VPLASAREESSIESAYTSRYAASVLRAVGNSLGDIVDIAIAVKAVLYRSDDDGWCCADGGGIPEGAIEGAGILARHARTRVLDARTACDNSAQVQYTSLERHRTVDFIRCRNNLLQLGYCAEIRIAQNSRL